MSQLAVYYVTISFVMIVVMEALIMGKILYKLCLHYSPYVRKMFCVNYEYVSSKKLSSEIKEFVVLWSAIAVCIGILWPLIISAYIVTIFR